MAILFKIVRNGNDFYTTADGEPQFFVGRRVPYEGNIGLYNIFAGSKLEKLNYAAADYAQKNGFWAYFIEPTAICEGRSFLTLNTYDRAAFTFGFGQFAAHVAKGDFVKYFRAMLQLPNAVDYFPHLAVVNGHVSTTDGPQAVPLETDQTTKDLMDYLNPDLSEVQDSEVIAAAKLIHWTSGSPAARAAQVDEMIGTFRDFMARADFRVGIDGRPAEQCCAIADILHQGRGGAMTWPLIDAALKGANPLDALLAIGPKWIERAKKLRAAIKANPDFAAKHWSRAKKDFV